MLVKEAFPRGCWCTGKVVSLVQRQDGCLWSARVSLPSGLLIGCPFNLLFSIEVSGNSRSDDRS